MKYATGLISLIITAVAFSGCARKAVYVPQEWQAGSPPPSTSAPVAPSPLKPPPSPAPAPLQSPVLKPPPTISEKNLSPGSEPAVSPVPKKPVQAPPPPQPAPQQLASMHLVEQAKASLAQGKPDVAIAVLEQAIQVDVHNGEAFLGLARAWRMKGSRNKSLEFSRKAEILFQENRGKLKEVYLFQSDLYKEMGDTAKSEQYRQKASKP